MNHRTDIDRVMEVWMADGPTAIPDRVVDVVAARIGVQRQRRAWPFQGRTIVTPLKLAAGLAAAIVVAVVGIAILGQPRGSNVGGSGSPAPTPSPVASAVPSPAASAGAACPQWLTTGCSGGAGILSAGSQASRAFRPGFTFTVPEGWVNEHDEIGYYDLFPDTPANQAEFARSEAMAQAMAMGPHESPYFFCESIENNRGATAAEMVAALVANEAIATTGLVDVAIGGLTGKQFDVRLNPDWTGTCPPSPDDPPGLNLGELRTRGILLDSPDRGVIVVFVGSMYSADFEAFLAEAMPIIESFQFDVAQ